MKNILILGLGNPILSDDAIGIRVVQQLKTLLGKDSNVEIKDTSLGGINLLELIRGYQKLILIDSIKTPDGIPGQVHEFKMNDFRQTIHLSSIHDINFATVMKLGEKLGFKMPKETQIFAVEIVDDTTFSEKMTPQLEKAFPEIIDTILKAVIK